MRPSGRMTALRARRDDRGQAGGWEIVPFGLFVFVVGSLLIANVWAVIDAKYVVVDAAREGARAYVRADDEEQARAAARRSAEDVVRAHRRAHDHIEYPDPVVSPRFERCARVAVTVRDRVPALALPFVGRWGSGFTVSATQHELIDPYRDGLPEGSSCVD